MYPRAVVVFLLGMTGLLATMTPEKSKGKVIKPVGPKMCARLCSEMGGCTSYIFVAEQLSCQLTDIDSNRPDREEGTYLLKVQKNKIRETVEAKLNCQKKRNNLHCSRVWHRSRNEGRKSRILMMSSGSPMKGKVLYLHNNSIAPYPYISIDYGSLFAMVYISSTRMIVVSTDEKLWFFLLDSGKTLRTREVICVGLSVDKSRQLMFCTQDGRIIVMSTEGDNIKSVVSKSGDAGTVVCDPKRSEIYVSYSYDAVYRFTYTGDYRGTVAKDQTSNGLCIDTKKDVLYILQTTIINKFDLSTKRTTRVASLKISFTWLRVFRNTLYLSRGRSEEIKTVNTESDVEGVINPGLDEYGIIMCAIP